MTMKISSCDKMFLFVGYYILRFSLIDTGKVGSLFCWIKNEI